MQPPPSIGTPAPDTRLAALFILKGSREVLSCQALYILEKKENESQRWEE